MYVGHSGGTGHGLSYSRYLQAWHYESGATSTYAYNQDGERTCATPGNSIGASCAIPNPTYASTYGYNSSMEMTCMTPANTSGVTCGDPSTATSYEYTYNAEGLRTSETLPGGTTQRFTWNILSSVPQLLMDGSNAYIYGPQGTPLGSAPIEQVSLAAPNSQSSVTYLYSDPEGVRLTFNSIGIIAAGASYDAYGNVIAGGLSSVTPFGYAGGYTDPTGLIYFVNRYYDPSTGQFLSVDPLVGITDQPYEYAGSDPVNLTDPTGLVCWAALELGLTKASRQCWKSGYKKAIHIVKHYTFLGHSTLRVCLGISIAMVFGGTASICVGESDLSQIGITESVGTEFGLYASGGLSGSYSGACALHQLAGPFWGVSGGWDYGGSYQWGTSQGNHIHVFSGGAGTYGLAGEKTYTWVQAVGSTPCGC